MDKFCSSEFWDEDLTWNTLSPVFSPCFLKIAFLWGPVLFFWVFLPADVYFVLRSKERRIPWSTLNITKFVGVFFLLVLSATEMIYQMILYTKLDVRPVEYYTPFVLFITMAAVLFLTLSMRRKGVTTSGVLFLFWFFLTIGTGIGFYTAMQKTFNQVLWLSSGFEGKP